MSQLLESTLNEINESVKEAEELLNLIGVEISESVDTAEDFVEVVAQILDENELDERVEDALCIHIALIEAALETRNIALQEQEELGEGSFTKQQRIDAAHAKALKMARKPEAMAREAKRKATMKDLKRVARKQGRDELAGVHDPLSDRPRGHIVAKAPALQRVKALLAKQAAAAGTEAPKIKLTPKSDSGKSKDTAEKLKGVAWELQHAVASKKKKDSPKLAAAKKKIMLRRKMDKAAAELEKEREGEEHGHDDISSAMKAMGWED